MNFMYPEPVGHEGANELDIAFEKIIEALQLGDVQFLFGAGMSKSSDVPIGSELALKLLEKKFPKSGVVKPPDKQKMLKLTQEFPFEILVEAIEKHTEKTRNSLTRYLKSILIKEYKIGQEYHDFLSIFNTYRLDTILTTNFDLIFEQLLGENRSITITEENTKEIKRARQESKIPILHLHGVLDKDYQITETDLYERKDRYKFMNSQFEQYLHGCEVFIFVGYSLSDPDLKTIYRRFLEDIEFRKRTEGKITYFVSPVKDNYSYLLGRDIWKSRGALWIPLDSKTFFGRIKSMMLDKGTIKMRKIIMEEFNKGDDDQVEELIKKTAEILSISHSDAMHFLVEIKREKGDKND